MGANTGKEKTKACVIQAQQEKKQKIIINKQKTTPLEELSESELCCKWDSLTVKEKEELKSNICYDQNWPLLWAKICLDNNINKPIEGPPLSIYDIKYFYLIQDICVNKLTKTANCNITIANSYLSYRIKHSCEVIWRILLKLYISYPDNRVEVENCWINLIKHNMHYFMLLHHKNFEYIILNGCLNIIKYLWSIWSHEQQIYILSNSTYLLGDVVKLAKTEESIEIVNIIFNMFKEKYGTFIPNNLVLTILGNVYFLENYCDTGNVDMWVFNAFKKHGFEITVDIWEFFVLVKNNIDRNTIKILIEDLKYENCNIPIVFVACYWFDHYLDFQYTLVEKYLSDPRYLSRFISSMFAQIKEFKNKSFDQSIRKIFNIIDKQAPSEEIKYALTNTLFDILIEHDVEGKSLLTLDEMLKQEIELNKYGHKQYMNYIIGIIHKLEDQSFDIGNKIYIMDTSYIYKLYKKNYFYDNVKQEQIKMYLKSISVCRKRGEHANVNTDDFLKPMKLACVREDILFLTEMFQLFVFDDIKIWTSLYRHNAHPKVKSWIRKHMNLDDPVFKEDVLMSNIQILDK